MDFDYRDIRSYYEREAYNLSKRLKNTLVAGSVAGFLLLLSGGYSLLRGDTISKTICGLSAVACVGALKKSLNTLEELSKTNDVIQDNSNEELHSLLKNVYLKLSEADERKRGQQPEETQ